MFGGSMSRTQWTVTEAGLGLLAQMNISWSRVFTDLQFAERGATESLSWHSSRPWSLLLTGAKAEARLSLRGSAPAADSRLLS